MSLILLARVFRTPMTSSTDKLVLLALAEHAWDDGGHAFPSVRRLMQFSALDRRSVQRGLRRLEADKYITVSEDADAEMRRPTTYMINEDRLAAPTGGTAPPPPASQRRPPRVTAPPEPLVNPSEEPLQPPTLSGKPDDAQDILNFLNRKAARNYQSGINLDLIRARLKAGATIYQCKAIISRKVRAWQGSDMEKYLRPATLFNATKFAQYLGELPATMFSPEGEASNA